MKRLLILNCLLLVAGLAWGETGPSAPTAAARSAAEETARFSGKVVETMNAAGYTYALIDTGKDRKWVAAPQFPVKVGDAATVVEGMPMPKHHSKTLNRDFDMVYFAAGVSVNGQAPASGAPPATQSVLPPNHPPIEGAASLAGLASELPKNHPPITGAQVAPKMDYTGLQKPAGGKTIAEICAGSVKLQGQEVKLRGKVVKYNAQILGKNWLHVRDGTGGAGSNDLLVTTTTAAKVGDTVLVIGVVVTHKDFGANYKYDVMLDNARVTVE